MAQIAASYGAVFAGVPGPFGAFQRIPVPFAPKLGALSEGGDEPHLSYRQDAVQQEPFSTPVSVQSSPSPSEPTPRLDADRQTTARFLATSMASQSPSLPILQRNATGYPLGDGTVRVGLPPPQVGLLSRSKPIAGAFSEITPADEPGGSCDSPLEEISTPFAAPAVQLSSLQDRQSTPQASPAARVATAPAGISTTELLHLDSGDPAVTMAMVALGLVVTKGELGSVGPRDEKAFCPDSLNTYAWPTQQWDVDHRYDLYVTRIIVFNKKRL